MDQSGRLQDVAGPLATKPGRRPAAKLLMHHVDELITRVGVSATPGAEQTGHVFRRMVHVSSHCGSMSTFCRASRVI